MSQCRPSGVSTGLFGKRVTVVASSVSGPTCPTMTRPLVAPKSIAATAPEVIGRTRRLRAFRLVAKTRTERAPASRSVLAQRPEATTRSLSERSETKGREPPNPGSSEEGGGDAGVDRDVQAGGAAQLGSGEDVHR